MSITRCDWGNNGMEQHPRGDYVPWGEYEEEIESLKEDIKNLREAIRSAKEALDI